MVARRSLMVFRAKGYHQPVRSPLRPADGVTRMMQVSRRVTVPKMVTKHTT